MRHIELIVKDIRKLAQERSSAIDLDDVDLLQQTIDDMHEAAKDQLFRDVVKEAIKLGEVFRRLIQAERTWELVHRLDDLYVELTSTLSYDIGDAIAAACEGHLA